MIVLEVLFLGLRCCVSKDFCVGGRWKGTGEERRGRVVVFSLVECVANDVTHERSRF